MEVGMYGSAAADANVLAKDITIHDEGQPKRRIAAEEDGGGF